MSRDEAIKYNSLYQEVELAISNIKNLGFEVKEFENKLKIIHNEVNNDVKVDYVKGMAEASYIQSYTKGISELNKLKIKLDNYNIYAVAYNTCNYINNKINDEITIDELERLVSKIIYVLKSINKSSTIDYDNEKHIVEKIYETAYLIIKYEILMTGQSQLYLFVKSEDVNISYFNNLIIKDIEKIDLKLEENKRIETKMFELGQSGIYSNYLDLELIKLILLTDKEHDLKGIIVKNISDMSDKIVKETKSIINSKDYLNNELNTEKRLKMNIQKGIKNVKKRIASLALSLSILAGGSFGITKLAEKIEDKSPYDKKVEIYSTETGSANYTEKIALKSDADPQDSIMLRIYDGDGNDYHYQEYDISDKNYDDMRDYYDYARDNYDTKGLKVEIEKNTYSRHNTKVDAIVILHIVYLILLLILDAATMGKMYDEIDFVNYVRIKNIKKILKQISYDKEKLERYSEEVDVLVNSVLNDINNNDELRSRFLVLYEENKYLLDNPEELYQKINDVKDLENLENVKKLIKERNK